jgi:hypothetical protein
MPRGKNKPADVVMEACPVATPSPLTAEELLREHFTIADYIAGEEKRFAEFLQPYRERDNILRAQMQDKLNNLGVDSERRSIRTDFGTIYNSTVTTPKIVDREKYLDLVLDNYETWGNGMLQLRAPNKESVDNFIRENNGQLPDGVEISSILHLNIRRA